MRLIFFIVLAISTLHSLNYHGCALAPDNINAWVVCLDTVLILKTSDAGVSWFPQPAPLNTKRFFDVTCTDDQNAWTCGILGEILHTNDGGANWTGQVIGLSKYATRIEFYDNNYGWTVCGDGALGWTRNGGVQWNCEFIPWMYEYYGLSFIDTLTGWIVAGYPDSMLTGQGLVLKSTNGGINWDSVYQVSDYTDFFDVHFFNLLEGIVVGGDELDTSATIIRTTSGGLSWNPITPPLNSYYLRAVDFVGVDGWAVGRFGTIIHTSDAGNTWTFQNNPATTTLFDIDFSDSQHGIACGQDIILITSDGGQTWTETEINENRSCGPGVFTLKIYPNPCRAFCNIKIDTRLSAGDIKIYDVSGQLIRNLSLPTSYFQVPTAVSWDGRDDNQQKVPAGIYIIIIDNALITQRAKIILIE